MSRGDNQPQVGRMQQVMYHYYGNGSCPCYSQGLSLCNVSGWETTIGTSYEGGGEGQDHQDGQFSSNSGQSSITDSSIKSSTLSGNTSLEVLPHPNSRGGLSYHQDLSLPELSQAMHKNINTEVIPETQIQGCGILETQESVGGKLESYSLDSEKASSKEHISGPSIFRIRRSRRR